MKKKISVIIAVIAFLAIIGSVAFSVYRSSDSFEKQATEHSEQEQMLKDYTQNEDGTWSCDGNTYQYLLEISGRMSNAAKDSTFVYLSNLEEITFDQAWKAAGLSSNSNDYFDVKDAVLVELRTEG